MLGAASYAICGYGNLPIIQVLANGGANPHLLDEEGKTPLVSVRTILCFFINRKIHLNQPALILLRS